ncbi:MAG: extracellular solute-binding protein, partial [Saccharofermentanales bacterium]
NLERFADNPDRVTANMTEMNMIMAGLGNWAEVLKNSSLAVDYIEISAPESATASPKSSLWQKLKATFLNVYLSFFKDYGSLNTEDTGGTAAVNSIKVWTSTGYEWGSILKRQIDENFTAVNGIGVDLNVLPAGQVNAGQVNAVMLAAIGGNAPDVAIGLNQSSPSEFAMRNVTYNLKNFEDFEEVVRAFTPESTVPFRYNGGVHGLPQTIDFKVMFYRKDILAKYQIELPDTWKELYENVLPVLYDNKLACFIPQDISLFLFQNGGSFFTADGLQSNLDTKEAFIAFREMVELNTRYGIPVTTNFFNRFRIGQIPLGISTMGDYMQLMAAAPELSGRWGIAPIPGTVGSDGKINRSAGSLVGQAAILLNSSQKKEESWEFLKWWLGTEEQTRYGQEVETMIGARARWNSANIEAFKNQNWRSEDLNVILRCFENQKETQNFPGAYMTSREIGNAWNSMILGSSSRTLREALEYAVKNINLEMKQKQKEFDYAGEQQ